ncbi:endonuclease III domain-containing protein [Virgibacillus sp. 179-BFC.A HS]|uniref:Endonuclease III domain-containing protein n=1 Tax=Tigheibacillus jepli TaxID=3035914 RepID=A0ABU5CJ84_9BACI|nr:endonuclease III domain-containing protein [Virgibacillus sp. 179-BFC.A HS]MDY0406295.1 endonuclease III domain-containing protein [Virgibacillus sp. 179-BFC.A HS]
MEHDYQLIFEKLFNQYGPQNWWPADSPFEMMIGAILVQNTNWRNADKALRNLGNLLEPEIMFHMSETELAERIRSSGFYRLKAKRIKAFMEWFNSYHFCVENIKKRDKDTLRNELLQINGIGRETADVMLVYAFEKPVFVVDAYARRIFYRLGYDMPATYDAFRQQVEEHFPSDVQLYNEFHALLDEHAKNICRKKPLCSKCPLKDVCAQRF